MTVGSNKTVRECSATEICEAFPLSEAGASKKLRVYRALTLDPFHPAALQYGLVTYSAAPIASPYWRSAGIVAIEYAVTTSPTAVRYDFEEMQRDQQYPLIGTPTYLSDGNEFYDNTADYRERLDAVLSVTDSLEQAYAGMVTLLGWAGRMLSHRELGEFDLSDEIFHPDRFTPTPFYEAWLDSTDLEGRSIETEMMDRLRRGDVALTYLGDQRSAFVCRHDGWLKWRAGKAFSAAESTIVKAFRSSPDCSLLPIPSAEKYLGYSIKYK